MYDEHIECQDPDCITCGIIHGWVEVLEPEEAAEIAPRCRRLDLADLRSKVRRPSKFRRIIWGLETIAHGYWQRFLEWRSGNTNGAQNWCALEHAFKYLSVIGLALAIVHVLATSGVGR